MGTGYNRNLSQWSEGEYYMANNTQDDLSIIAGKLSYRSDDHGDTRTTATALNLTGGTNIVSTTPETDPTNSDPSNKGIIERSTDVDVFSFVTGAGQIRVTVNPWIGPSGTKGGNLDLLLELYDANGTLLTTTNPPNQTIAQIQTTVAEGRYFLQVRNTGAGDPFGSTPTGYTSYASIGQYFISGYLQPSTFVAPPIAEAQPVNVTLPDVGANQFTVTYSDDLAVDASTIDGNDIRITGPNSYDRLARLVSIDSLSSGTPRVATYAVDPPSATAWMPADNGIYTVWMRSNEVRDSQGVAVAGNSLGQFTVNVPTAFYSADMNTDPGWTLEPLWQYGPPAYPGTGPVSGFSGANIIAYNLSGNYQNNLSTKYATTPLIDCSGRSNLVLRFQRWLRLRSNDTALIQVTTNGSTWADVWSTTQTVSDNAWLLTQYALPSWVSGSAAVQLRWGISSGGSQNDIGWNLDDVQLLGLGSPATIPSVVLTVDVNNPNWGTVDPGGGTFQRGTSVQISATPAPYFRFVGWMGDTFSSSNPLGVVLNTDISVQAVFEELVTTNHSIPYWWLASHGRTNDFNNAELLNGANGIPVWESYVAGLDPNDPESQLRLTMRLSLDGANVVLNWNTVTGRVYTVYSSTNLGQGFLPLPSGADLPATMASFTNDCSTPSVTLYRVGVRKP
jgi:hypothetical protein